MKLCRTVLYGPTLPDRMFGFHCLLYRGCNRYFSAFSGGSYEIMVKCLSFTHPHSISAHPFQNTTKKTKTTKLKNKNKLENRYLKLGNF